MAVEWRRGLRLDLGSHRHKQVGLPLSSALAESWPSGPGLLKGRRALTIFSIRPVWGTRWVLGSCLCPVEPPTLSRSPLPRAPQNYRQREVPLGLCCHFQQC